MNRPVDALLDYLRAEERRGVSHVYLDEGAREALRELFLRSRGKRPATRPQPATTESAPEVAIEAPKPVAVPATVGSPAERIAALAAAAETWEPARRLGTLRETMVFSVGNPQARLMLIGEAPGHHEERHREPFVGPAGQKLTAILKAMGLERSEVYISNIVKFRPALPNQTINNRKPTPEEMATCLPLVLEEIRIVQPELIVALGGTAAEGLLQTQTGVGALRGRWHEFEGIPLRVTFHPSYLLHNDDAISEKRKVWEDMLAVMERLEMPISEKQRGFFRRG